MLAHTGGEDEFPGSTMFAFGESMKAGVDMLDLNVQLTGDGVVIIQHDDTVDRTTEGTGDVVDMDLATVQALDNAYSFTDGRAARTTTTSTAASAPASGRRRPATRADDFAVPTLRQLVERYPDVPLNVEIEGDGDRGRGPRPPPSPCSPSSAAWTPPSSARSTTASSRSSTQLAPTAEISPGLDTSAAWVLNGEPLPPASASSSCRRSTRASTC